MTALRALCILLFLVISGLCCRLVEAQVCSSAEANDLNKTDRWLTDARLKEIVVGERADWAAAASRLQLLRQHFAREFEETGFTPVRDLERFVGEVLDGYDGSSARAKMLRVADIKPQTCGVDAEGELLCAWQALHGAIAVPIEDAAPYTCPHKLRLANDVAALLTVLSRQLQPHFDAAARNLERHARAWQRLVSNGYSQYPWEVLFNGLWVREEEWGPNPNQAILVHGAVGLGTSGVGASDGLTAEPAAVIAIEALGYLRYFRDFRHHVGLSGAALLSNLRWQELAVGPVLHFDGFGLGYGMGVRGEHAQTVYLLFDVTRSIDDYLLLRNASAALREQLD